VLNVEKIKIKSTFKPILLELDLRYCNCHSHTKRIHICIWNK